jgi:hypothetical protein
MPTPLDIIKLALKDAGALGVGQTPLSEDVDDAFRRLNWMVSTWARKRWLIWHLVDVAKISTGAQSYTVGPGGDFNLPRRPHRLHAAFLRQNPGAPIPSNPPVTVTPSGSPFVYIAPSNGTLLVSGGNVTGLFVSRISGDSAWQTTTSPISLSADDAVQVVYTVAPAMSFTPAVSNNIQGTIPSNAVDFPLEVLQSREDYNRIRIKGLQSFPSYIFYDTDYPIGRVWPYPYPQANLYELHLTFMEQLPEFTSLTQEIALPPEYMAALHYNLALRLRSAYQLPVPPNDMVAALANDALNTIRGANTQIGRLTMPIGLSGGRIYNPYSDQVR